MTTGVQKIQAKTRHNLLHKALFEKKSSQEKFTGVMKEALSWVG
jgi:hypothetical protein